MGKLDRRIADLFAISPLRRSRDFTAAGIPRIALTRAIASGSLKRLARGVYCLAAFREGEYGSFALVAGKGAGIGCLPPIRPQLSRANDPVTLRGLDRFSQQGLGSQVGVPAPSHHSIRREISRSWCHYRDGRWIAGEGHDNREDDRRLFQITQ